LTTKIHSITATRGRPLRLISTGGEAHDSTTATGLLNGRPAVGVIADKAHDNNALRELIGNAKAKAIIAQLPQSPYRTTVSPIDCALLQQA
jgi:transposase